MVFRADMLHCRGGVFYTGHTDDLEHRIAEHKSGLIPGFTQNSHPLKLVWTDEFPTREEALRAERRIKGWSRRKKLLLIRGTGRRFPAWPKVKAVLRQARDEWGKGALEF
jgi:predicted GIY-YIG superfamily endonuclease